MITKLQKRKRKETVIDQANKMIEDLENNNPSAADKKLILHTKRMVLDLQSDSSSEDEGSPSSSDDDEEPQFKKSKNENNNNERNNEEVTEEVDEIDVQKPCSSNTNVNELTTFEKQLFSKMEEIANEIKSLKDRVNKIEQEQEQEQEQEKNEEKIKEKTNQTKKTTKKSGYDMLDHTWMPELRRLISSLKSDIIQTQKDITYIKNKLE